jgi:hypothetical protein
MPAAARLPMFFGTFHSNKRFTAMARLFKSYLQGDFGGEHKNFEAVVLEGNTLQHWWRNNAEKAKPWQRAQRIVENRAAFPGSLIQSDFKSGDHGNFEVVVPLSNEQGGVELWHLWHDNADVSNPWSFGQRITEAGRLVTGPASIIQSDFKPGDHGNFEVVVPVVGDDGRVELRHYWHDNSDVDSPWMRGQRVNDPGHEVIGGGCIIQSSFKSGAHGNFEVAAWVKLPDGRPVLQHYWHDNSAVELPWQNGLVIAEGAKGNGVLIQSSFTPGDHGNFEVVVPVEGSDGRTYVQHVWHDNTDPTLPWQRGQVISEAGAGNGSAAIFQGSYRTGDPNHGNFEVLLEECQQTLVGYWHPSEEANLRWLRHVVLIPDPASAEIRNTERICQLTGEWDRTGWNGTGTPPFAFNKTESRYGIRGTDLGVSFEHKNRVYFLFGDTWRVGEALESRYNWDAVAFCTDTSVQGGLSLTFHKQWPVVSGIAQGTFEVPLDGFSYGGLMFAFFSTDHRKFGDNELMGRSLVAVSENDGYDFLPWLNFSGNKFINVSVVHATLDAEQARGLGWPEGAEVLWVWGSGGYRASPPYLAVCHLGDLAGSVRAEQIRQGNGGPVELSKINGERGPVRFFTGTDRRVRWSANEWEAVPLFCAGDIGELSVRRNEPFNRYFFTYNTANPRGITLRHAVQPWGPWSKGSTIFDPFWETGPGQPKIGYGRFMHQPPAKNQPPIDHVQDDVFLTGPRNEEWGGEYGPYQITRYSTGKTGEFCDLYYTMSTWNPYQSVLMRTRILASDLL